MGIGQALASGQPLDLLAEVSSLVAALDPRMRHPLETGEEPAAPTLDEVITSFAAVDQVETSALLAGIAHLGPDELGRARARRHLSGRRHDLPGWLVHLGDTEVDRAVEMVHVLGDGDDVLLGLLVPDGAGGELPLSVVVYVDHNLGTVAKDAFVVPMAVDDLVELMRQHDELPDDIEWRTLQLDDARARITEAVEHGALLFPPLRSDSWPACRPLLEWALRLLPEGGTGYVRPEWDEPAKAALSEAFFASEAGRRLDDPEHRQLFDSILWFATDYGPGDPLRWSPTAVELLLSDWIPRKIVAPAALLTEAPAVLRAFIAYAHGQRGIRRGLTEETLAAVDEWEPDYQQAIRTPRPQGPMALLAAMGAIDPGGPWPAPDGIDGGDWLDDGGADGGDDEIGAGWPEAGSTTDDGAQVGWDAGVGVGWDDRWAGRAPRAGWDDRDIAAIVLDALRRQVGGDEALWSLNDAPLPDEPFSWDAIPDDIRPKVDEVLGRCDRCCDELLDVEYRTACRRLLARAARGDPEAFRRRGRADTAAAAICWAVGKANELFAPSSGGLLVKDLAAHFGLGPGSVSQRAGTLLKAAGVDESWRTWDLSLGTPELLVGARRRRIRERRDRYAEVPPTSRP